MSDHSLSAGNPVGTRLRLLVRQSRKPRARPMAAAIAAPLSRISSRTERSTVGSGQYSPAESMLHHTSESAQGSIWK